MTLFRVNIALLPFHKLTTQFHGELINLVSAAALFRVTCTVYDFHSFGLSPSDLMNLAAHRILPVTQINDDVEVFTTNSNLLSRHTSSSDLLCLLFLGSLLGLAGLDLLFASFLGAGVVRELEVRRTLLHVACVSRLLPSCGFA